MSENSDKDNKPQVTSKGVSGTKELRVRRVHKKKAEPSTGAEEAVKAAEEKVVSKPAAVKTSVKPSKEADTKLFGTGNTLARYLWLVILIGILTH